MLSDANGNRRGNVNVPASCVRTPALDLWQSSRLDSVPGKTKSSPVLLPRLNGGTFTLTQCLLFMQRLNKVVDSPDSGWLLFVKALSFLGRLRMPPSFVVERGLCFKRKAGYLADAVTVILIWGLLFSPFSEIKETVEAFYAFLHIQSSHGWDPQ